MNFSKVDYFPVFREVIWIDIDRKGTCLINLSLVLNVTINGKIKSTNERLETKND